MTEMSKLLLDGLLRHLTHTQTMSLYNFDLAPPACQRIHLCEISNQSTRWTNAASYTDIYVFQIMYLVIWQVDIFGLESNVLTIMGLP